MNVHLIHTFAHTFPSKARKKREPPFFRTVPANPCDCLLFLLTEVALQQALEGLAVTGFVRGSSPLGLYLAGGASTLKRFDIVGFLSAGEMGKAA